MNISEPSSVEADVYVRRSVLLEEERTSLSWPALMVRQTRTKYSFSTHRISGEEPSSHTGQHLAQKYYKQPDLL